MWLRVFCERVFFLSNPEYMTQLLCWVFDVGSTRLGLGLGGLGIRIRLDSNLMILSQMHLSFNLSHVKKSNLDRG